MARGIDAPNWTQVPNAILDNMKRGQISNSALRVILAVCRKTAGWGKRTDLISISQLVEATGLCKRAVLYGIQEAALNGVLDREPIDPANLWKGYRYSLAVTADDREYEWVLPRREGKGVVHQSHQGGAPDTHTKEISTKEGEVSTPNYSVVDSTTSPDSEFSDILEGLFAPPKAQP